MERDIFMHIKHKIFVTKAALPYAEDFLNAEKMFHEIIDDERNVPSGEKNIIFTVNKGRFLQSCPGTPGYICCGYYVLSPVENCPFSCTYCILNAYFDTGNIVVYANTDKMIKELEGIKGKKIRRIGTGEFSDSMFMPATLFYLEALLQFFDKNPDMFLELKTKSAHIPKRFLEKRHGNVIFSWSLNSDKIYKSEEKGASPVNKRIAAAKKTAAAGYKLSFHFDPVIHYPDWEKDYYKTIKTLFKSVPAESILWISIGTLRFVPALKDIATNLYPETDIFSHEFIRGLDGKKRYFRKTRVEIYKKMLAMIREFSPDVFVYLCMENEDVWEDVFGAGMSTKKLKELMDARLDK